MSFLPIVQRELRAAARRRSTFRVRWWATLLGLGLTLLSVIWLTLSRGRTAGNPLFAMFTGYAFVLALLAGVLLTSDSLTEEKRDGTLGLLFLTNLKGYDVVLGKFIAQSLNAFFCLLALLPVAAFPILLGGVQGAEFWRTALALANALLFSLAAGLAVSAFMQDSQRAMGNTLGLILLMAAALPFFKEISGPLKIPPFWTYCAWVSPFYPFRYAAEMLYIRHAGAYWGSLGASLLMGCGFLAAASLVLPRMVQERRTVRQIRLRRPSAIRSPRRTRTALLSANPVQWLRTSELGIPWMAWVIVLVSTVTVVLMLQFGGANPPFLIAQYTSPFGFLLKVIFALQVCRFFVEARRNGSLELLLCTPLTDQEIIRGQIKALWLTFAWPLAVFVLGLFASFTLKAVPALFARQFDVLLASLGGAFLSSVYTVRLAADLYAILWFGMGLALTGRKPALAPALTILFVLVLPAPLSFCWLDFLVDLALISWGTNKCRLNLRRLIAEQYQTSPTAFPQPSSSFPQPPPVIAPR